MAKYEAGFWYDSDPIVTVELESHDLAEESIKDHMQTLFYDRIHSIQTEMEQLSFIEDWEDAPKGDNVDHYAVRVEQHFWVRYTE